MSRLLGGGFWDRIDLRGFLCGQGLSLRLLLSSLAGCYRTEGSYLS